MSEILETARAVIARHDASPNSMHMSFCDAAPALAREVIRLHASVTPEDREAATWLMTRAAFWDEYASLDDDAARYRRAAEALLRPDETAALRRLLAEAREAVVTCLDVWPDGAVGQKCADLLARIDAATKGGGK